MTRVPVQELAPGQHTAAPVIAEDGATVVPAGTELTPSLIARLGEMGIDSVVVAPPTDMPPVDPRLADVESRFRGHEADPWMMALKDIVVRQLDESTPRS